MQKRIFESPARAPFQMKSRIVLQVLCLALLLAARCNAQGRPASPSLPTLPSGVPANSREDYDIPSRDPAEEARRRVALNVERQKALVSEANKLFKLATQLNAEIAGANPESLTPAQLRKLAEIEKLAHEVKEKMTTPAWATTIVQAPLNH